LVLYIFIIAITISITVNNYGLYHDPF